MLCIAPGAKDQKINKTQYLPQKSVFYIKSMIQLIKFLFIFHLRETHVLPAAMYVCSQTSKQTKKHSDCITYLERASISSLQVR